MALVGQVDQMEFLMSCQVSHSFERHFTFRARKRSVTNMTPSMDAKFRCSLELLGTMGALIRFLTSVGPAVNNQL